MALGISLWTGQATMQGASGHWMQRSAARRASSSVSGKTAASKSLSRSSAERALVPRAVEGDARACGRVVEVHAPRLYRRVRRAAPDGAEAEAVVQEAWLRAWKNRRRCAPNRAVFSCLAWTA